MKTKKIKLSPQLTQKLISVFAPSAPLFSSDESFITDEVLQFIINLEWFNGAKFQRLFGDGRVCYECRCPKCGRVYERTGTKSTVAAYISERRREKAGKPNNRKYIMTTFWCDKCVQEQKNQEQRKDEEYRQVQESTRKERLELYISSYLNPDKQWKAGVKAWDKYQRIALDSDLEEGVAEYIRSMPYHAFLVSPYWVAISEIVRRRAKYTCKMCGATGVRLNVHHPNYEHHGYELQNINGLVCLCDKCHSLFHKGRH